MQKFHREEDSPSPIPEDEKVSILSLAVMHRGINHKSPSSFNLEDLTDSFTLSASRKPFKLLDFKEEPSHRRQPSMLVNNKSQKYAFTKAISPNSSYGEFSNKKAKPFNNSKNSMFASTLEPKSSQHNSELQSSIFESRIEEESFDARTYTTANTQHTRNHSIHAPKEEEALGVLPTKAYCNYCGTETYTVLSLKMPTIPSWKVICCVGDFLKCCSNPEEWERYQKVYHTCIRCSHLVGIFDPSNV